MIQIILIFLFLILIFYQSNYSVEDCIDISGQYQIMQKDPIYDTDVNINIILEKDEINKCFFKSNKLSIKTLLNNNFIRDSDLEIEILVTDIILNGGAKIIYKEKKNNTFIEYIGYINNKNIFIKKYNEIFILKKL
jgi:hypothetical protein